MNDIQRSPKTQSLMEYRANLQREEQRKIKRVSEE